jgi:hypothetical protein
MLKAHKTFKIAGVVGVLCVLLSASGCGGKHDNSFAGKIKHDIKLGMTRSQVIGILGPPADSDAKALYPGWDTCIYYGTTPTGLYPWQLCFNDYGSLDGVGYEDTMITTTSEP